MNTVREAAVRVMPPTTESAYLNAPQRRNEVAEMNQVIRTVRQA